MEIKIKIQELPFSKGYYIFRFDIKHDFESIKFNKEIYNEININLKEQYGGLQIW